MYKWVMVLMIELPNGERIAERIPCKLEEQACVKTCHKLYIETGGSKSCAVFAVKPEDNK